MRIIVTGGAGFMGSSFIRFLVKNNLAAKVVNYDLLTYAGNLNNLKEIESENIYKFVKGDIQNKELLEKTVKENKIDTLVNFAAETHVDNSIKTPQVFLKTNVLGIGACLEIARKFDLRFHQVSTDEVFGALSLTEAPFNENTPYNPQSPYSASKAAGDHLAKSYFNTYKTRITVSNSSNNYGPFQYPEKIIPLFITNLIQDKKVPLYGDGLYVRDWLYVEDHSRAIWKILSKGEIGESYCIGGKSEKNNLQLTKILLKNLEKDESYIKHVEDRKGHDRRYAIDISKIKNELGWEPEVSFEEGIQKTITWYKKNKWWWKDLI